VQFPAAAPDCKQAGHQLCSGVSKTLLAGGSTQTACHFEGRITNAECRMTRPPFAFLLLSLINSTSAGATPAALTIFKCCRGRIDEAFVS
jgi:hypothetical protein